MIIYFLLITMCGTLGLFIFSLKLWCMFVIINTRLDCDYAVKIVTLMTLYYRVT